jgi:hypothetical protein
MNKQLKSLATGKPVWSDERIEDARLSFLAAAEKNDMDEVSRLAQYWLTEMRQDYEEVLTVGHEHLRRYMEDSINMAAGEYAELNARIAALEAIVASTPKCECPRCGISQPVEDVPATQAFTEL